MLKGLKSVGLKLFKCITYGLNGKGIRYAQIGGTPTFLE